jgi:uncharacterized glyoxalase superfamily protein PhnB
MTAINSITLDVNDPAAAADFYSTAFGLDSRTKLRAAAQPSVGFRGFTLSLVLASRISVDDLIHAALDAGAASLKPARTQMWGGYSGVVQAPDGTIWKVATSAKDDSGPSGRQPHEIVLLLGVADMAATKKFYVDRGFAVAKSFGRRYVEFTSAPGQVTLALYPRRALAKDAGVAPDGSGSHGLAIGTDAAAFTDPDGFVWETARS